jgi:peptide chain release factor 1
MLEKVRQLLERLRELEELLGAPDVLSDQKRFRELNQEHRYLCQLREVQEALLKVEEELKGSRELLSYPSLAEIARDEISRLELERDQLAKRLELLIVPPDPRDSRDIILELRAGTGGEEAALFVADCARMYRNFASSRNWKVEVLSSSPAEMGGYREYVMSMSGENVFRFMQYEGGTHRVQRVPDTETQGRVHTSAITVAILIEPEANEVSIEEKDLKIDTFRSSGAGGQHVNTTDSAVRITHLPTGVVVACQEERSQHKNRDKAMRLLKLRLAEEQERRARAEMSAARSSQVGSGDRSERIRTYNFPQNRITDHRIGLTVYNLDLVMEGKLDELTSALVAHYYAEKLKT